MKELGVRVSGVSVPGCWALATLFMNVLYNDSNIEQFEQCFRMQDLSFTCIAIGIGMWG